jgi:prepilin-type N-terminal cleavage/methylation domain-containing protein
LLNRIKGFSLFELVVTLTIIAVLIAIAIDKLPAWQALAERSAVENVAGSLRSALGIKLASCVAGNDMAGVRALEGSNPMDQLARVPDNYAGVRSAAETADMEAGQWYFDAPARELVYRVRDAEFFKTPPAVPAEARFAVQLVLGDRRRIEGVQLVEVKPYVWPSERASED